MVLKLIVVSQF